MSVDLTETGTSLVPLLLIYLPIGVIAVFFCEASFWGLMKVWGFTTLIISLMVGFVGP